MIKISRPWHGLQSFHFQDHPMNSCALFHYLLICFIITSVELYTHSIGGSASGNESSSAIISHELDDSGDGERQPCFAKTSRSDTPELVNLGVSLIE